MLFGWVGSEWGLGDRQAWVDVWVGAWVHGWVHGWVDAWVCSAVGVTMVILLRGHNLFYWILDRDGSV